MYLVNKYVDKLQVCIIACVVLKIWLKIRVHGYVYSCISSFDGGVGQSIYICVAVSGRIHVDAAIVAARFIARRLVVPETRVRAWHVEDCLGHWCIHWPRWLAGQCRLTSDHNNRLYNHHDIWWFISYSCGSMVTWMHWCIVKCSLQKGSFSKSAGIRLRNHAVDWADLTDIALTRVVLLW